MGRQAHRAIDGNMRDSLSERMSVNTALFTDLYELTMLQAYWREQMSAEAVVSLSVRRVPEGPHFLLACGLDGVLTYLESLRFTEEELGHLRSLGLFEEGFLEWLRGF